MINGEIRVRACRHSWLVCLSDCLHCNSARQPVWRRLLLCPENISSYIIVNAGQGSHRFCRKGFHNLSMTISRFSIIVSLIKYCIHILQKRSENGLSELSKSHMNVVKSGGKIGQIPRLLANFSCSMTFT